MLVSLQFAVDDLKKVGDSPRRAERGPSIPSVQIMADILNPNDYGRWVGSILYRANIGGKT